MKMRLVVAVLVLFACGCGPREHSVAWTNGTPRRAGHVINNRQTGEWTYWYQSGKKEAQGSWKNDQQDGRWQWFHENSQLRQAGEYSKGKRTGMWLFWNEQGELIGQGAFQDDRQVGPWTAVNARGKTLSGTFSNGIFTNEQGNVVPPEKSELIPSPLAVLPGYWTTLEEMRANDLVEKYTTGKDVSGYTFTTSSAGSSKERDFNGIGKPLPQTRLLLSTGEVIDLNEYKGKKAVVLIVMRGFSGQVCVYCSTQTTAVAKNLQRFTSSGSEVFLIYPGPAASVPVFLEAVKSFGADISALRVALDVDLSLVRKLGIEDELSKPASLIVDMQGIVRWGYVGQDRADRPSVDELLKQIAGLPAGK
jgi:peroxiredoxin